MNDIDTGQTTARGTSRPTPAQVARPREEAAMGGLGCSALGVLRLCSAAGSASALGAITRSSARSWRRRSSARLSCRAFASATVRAEPRARCSSRCRHDLGLHHGQYLRPRQRLYRQAQRRYRRSREGRASFWPRSPRPSSTIRSRRRRPRSPRPRPPYVRPRPSRARQRDLGARQAARRARLGDAAARHDRRPEFAGAAGGRRRGAGECRGAAGADQGAAAAEGSIRSVVAPFDGIITQRNIDVGSLVQADATTGTFMFTMHADRRDPHPGLCAAGPGLRRGSPESRRWYACRSCRIAAFPAR